MKYFGILAYHAPYFDCLPFLKIEAVTSHCDTISQHFCIFVINYFILEVIDTIDDDIFFLFDSFLFSCRFLNQSLQVNSLQKSTRLYYKVVHVNRSPLKRIHAFFELFSVMHIPLLSAHFIIISAFNIKCKYLSSCQGLLFNYPVIISTKYKQYIDIYKPSTMSQQSSSAYEKYLTCLGGICGSLCCSYNRVETSTIGLMERFGKFKRVCNPGLNYFTPFVESIKPISLKTRVVDMQKQTVYTKDNMSIAIDTVLFFRIIDPFRATYVVKDILASVMQLTFVTLRTVCGQYVLQDMLTKRIQVNQKIETFVRKQSQQWGIYVDHLLMKDLHLSPFLSENLSKVSKTKRLVESKIISARADLESAKLYREAADILDIKAAMQIRFLQTLELMQSMKSKKTVIMPLHPAYE